MLCRFCKKEIPDAAAYCCYCGRLLARLPAPKKPYHANGFGYVFKRPGAKTYSARVTDMARSYRSADGKYHRKTYQKGGFTTENAARLWAIDWYNHRAEKPPAPPLMRYWDIYREGEYAKLSQSKQVAYQIAWRRLDPIASMDMDKITVADLRQVVKNNATSHYTGRDMKSLLSHLFNLAAADGYCQKDLPSFIILQDLNEKEAQPFSELEQKKMWQAYEAGDMVAAWPLLMIYTGMMPGETINLRIEMIDLEHRTIKGAGLKTTVRKKSAIYLTPTIIPVIQDLIGTRTEGHLFQRNKDNLYKDYHEFTRRIGIRDLDPYSCRHTTGTALAVDKNIAPETVRKIMRWSKTSNMIARYSHPDDKDALSAVAQLTRPDEEAE